MIHNEQISRYRDSLYSRVSAPLDGRLNDGVSQTRAAVAERNRSNILICYCKAINPCARALVSPGTGDVNAALKPGPRVNAAITPKWVNVGFQQGRRLPRRYRGRRRERARAGAARIRSLRQLGVCRNGDSAAGKYV